MSNLQDLIKIRYEYLVEEYLMVDNEPQVKLRKQVRLRNEMGVQIIPSQIVADRQREKQVDIWEESDFFLVELFSLRLYEPEPEPED
ncbi:hypothetical protein G5I_08612 [Acromyrmex echinatior]|uniref:Uncharacterized protein n=1 Tax=Acromyrmex echinatior TaxID=103372 RepID=F4WS05_ACREC|nr:hypothetical protein G5I_08612 [Acromyrmex echinatior]